jgi:hypothetical protein
MISTEESRTLTSLMTIENASTEEPVGWLSFIDDIHDIQRCLAYLPHIEELEVVSFVRLTRSWDFMPVEIVRPFASTTLGCLIAIVDRMGLTWIDFKPDEGILRAIGRGRSISSSRIRGLGLAIEYVGNGKSLQEMQNEEHERTASEAPVCIPGYYHEDNSRVYIL